MKQLIALVGVVLVAASPGAAARHGSVPSFEPAKKYVTTVDAPQAIAVGGLDGDGSTDVVTAHGCFEECPDGDTSIRAVSVFLNTGSGAFRAPVVYATGRPGDEHGAWSVAIGDLNGDGAGDLATANPGGHSVSVLLNRGDGSFEPSVTYGLGREPDDVAIADLNGDGKPDVLTANPNTVSVLLGDGDGKLESPVEYSTGRPSMNGSLVVGDLNGDGRLDLATANYRRGVTVLLARTDGGFEQVEDFATGPGPYSIAMGDVTSDGKPDLVTANGTHAAGGSWIDSLSVLRNRGDGSFRPRMDYAVRNCGRGVTCNPLGFSSVTIADLNGDHKPDLATGDTAPSIFAFESKTRLASVFTNRGAGTFAPRIDFGPQPGESEGYGIRAIAVGDLNGDGRPDLVVPRWQSIAVFLNRPGLCTVQDVMDQRLAAAKATITRGNCRLGRVRRTYDLFHSKGHVVTQKPAGGTVLPARSRVELVISRGSRPS
jgi:trimeric autotransporter adhesin